MERKSYLSLVVVGALAALSLSACGGDDDGTAGVDSGTPEIDGGAMTTDGGGDVDAGGTCAATIPERPYGIEVGRKFEPIELNTCADEPYDFYNQDYCDSTLTVLSIAAGWCGPCIIESGMLNDVITRPYGPRGVRVIQVMYQTDSFGPPDGAYCQAWVDRFGLENIQLYDPAQLVGVYFPAGALPATIIVDSEGTIVFREYGVSDELRTLRAKLDELLAERGM